jgi:hypothetical protein
VWNQPKSVWIAGGATFTIVESRMIISIPAHNPQGPATENAGERSLAREAKPSSQ